MKYEITNETHPTNPNLRRIRALKDFGIVEAGELGGFIESEKNLSHEGDCWVSGNSQVVGNAKVYGNARVHEYSVVSDNAQVSECAKVYGNARVFGNAAVSGKAKVSDYAVVFGDTEEPVSQFPNEITIDGVVYVKKG